MKVLSTVNDRSLGGRDFDDVIIEFLCETFQKKTGIDVRGNMKAWLKLQVAAEKAKKTLSPAGVNEAAVSVECLADDKDLSVVLTRDELEKRCAPLIAKLEAPVLRCLQEAGLQRGDISEVEIVGGTTRVNVVKRRLGEVLGLDPHALNFGLKTTMNSDEAVARGGALQVRDGRALVLVLVFVLTNPLCLCPCLNLLHLLFLTFTNLLILVLTNLTRRPSIRSTGCDVIESHASEAFRSRGACALRHCHQLRSSLRQHVRPRRGDPPQPHQ